MRGAGCASYGSGGGSSLGHSVLVLIGPTFRSVEGFAYCLDVT